MIELSKNNSKAEQLSFLEDSGDFPIGIKRVYWIYGIEKDVERGNHAHLNSGRIIVCLQGSTDITIENIACEIRTYHLHKPTQALFYPRNHWINLKIAKGSVVLARASCLYEQDKVEIAYPKFKQMILS